MNTLVFMHIMKTGGRSLATMLRQFFEPQDVYQARPLCTPIPAAARFVWGHLCYEHCHTVSNATTITLLRHPAHRVASLYHMLQRGHSLLPPETWSGYQHKPLLEVARLHVLQNGMVRQLCGHETVFRSAPVTKHDLDVAIAHLSTMIFGFTEDFDSFAEMICEHLGRKQPPYARKNVAAPYRTDEETLAELERLNWADVALYKWALENVKRI